MRFLQRSILFFILTIGFSIALNLNTALADNNSAKKEPRKQSLTFEDEMVEGSTQKPELFYLFQKKNFNFTRMIKLRDNFLPEMKRSAEDVQRGRSNN